MISQVKNEKKILQTPLIYVTKISFKIIRRKNAREGSDKRAFFSHRERLKASLPLEI